jgi:hypothetical protein
MHRYIKKIFIMILFLFLIPVFGFPQTEEYSAEFYQPFFYVGQAYYPSTAELTYSQNINLETQQKKGERKWLPALGQYVIVNGYLTWRYYYSDESVNIKDQDFNSSWDDMYQKWFTSDGYKLDTNYFHGNTFEHVVHGGIYYFAFRNNSFTPMESWLFAFVGSAAWEWGSEYLEIFSINDHIFTWIGGSVPAESLFRLSDFFKKSRPTILNTVLYYLTNPFAFPNELLNGRNPFRIVQKDYGSYGKYGFTDEVWHSFSFTLGMEGIKKKSETMTYHQAYRYPAFFEFSFLLYDIRDYLQKGRVEKWIDMGDSVRLESKVIYDPVDGFDYVEFLFQMNYYGYYYQNFIAAEEDKLSGISFFIALDTQLQYIQVKTSDPVLSESPIRIAVVDLLGIDLETAYHKKDFKMKWNLEFFANFAAVETLSTLSYHKTATEEELLTLPSEAQRALIRTPKDVPYYFALGISANIGMEIQYSFLYLAGKFSYHYFDNVYLQSFSEYTLDRTEEVYKNPATMKDTLTEFRVSAGAYLWENLRMLLYYQKKSLKSYWGERKASLLENRYGLSSTIFF